MVLSRKLVQRVTIGVLAAAVLVAAGLLVFRAVGAGRSGGLSANATQLATFTEHGVAVQIALENDGLSGPRLTGIFTPTDSAFHLYSKDLPPDGIQGLGRPTRLEIVSEDGVKSAGPLVVDQPIVQNDVPELGLSFPVYPAGAVSLHLPVDIPISSAPVATELSVTYMACKGGACLPPVIDKHVSVLIPGR